MTIKQLFKKVEAYNEIARKIGAHEIEVKVSFDYFWSENFSTFKSFKKYLDKEIAEEMAEMLLASKDFEIDGKTVIEWEDGWDGRMYQAEVDTYVYER